MSSCSCVYIIMVELFAHNNVLFAPFIQSMDGAVTGSWEGIRVNALATHPHQDLVYAADTHHRIRQYNFQDHSSSTV